jgi:hypothetical protein
MDFQEALSAMLIDMPHAGRANGFLARGLLTLWTEATTAPKHYL